MKKMLTIFAALIMAAVFVIMPAASAASNGAVFTMNDVDSVAPGGAFDVTLHISGDYQVHGMNLSIEFDPTAMVLEGIEQGDYLAGLSSSGKMVVLDSAAMANAGKIRLGVLCPSDPASGEGDMFTMHFRLNDGVNVNQQVIMVVQEFIYLPLGSFESTNVAFTTDNSVITVVGGSDPAGGYNEGGPGVGSNTSEAPNFPTRDPEDPNANVTPVVDMTSDPHAIPAVPVTSAPDTRSDDPNVTDVPASSDDPQQEDVTENAGGEAQTVSPAPTKPGTEKPRSVLPYVIGGAAVVLAAVAAVMVIGSKKRK